MGIILSDKSTFTTAVDTRELYTLERKVNLNQMKLLNKNAGNKEEFNLLKPIN